MSKTLYDKIWDDHLVHEDNDGTALLYVDRHLVHEVTSPQAFEGLRIQGRQVRKPKLTLAVPDHNVPTTDRSKGISDKQSKIQVDTLRNNCKEFGINLFDVNDKRQGIVHIIGPEQGFTQPGTVIVCGDSHTATHGAFGALAFGIGTSEVEHVLATQTLIQKKSKNFRINVNGDLPKGVTAKGGLSAYLFWKAVTLGRKKLLGQTLSVTEAVLDKCLDLLIRKKVKQRFGGRLAFFVSGGAALNPDIGSFFLSLGVNILQGYGQTEASPLISANRPGRIRIETVGPAVDGVEIKLAGDGELLARGACLMKGYWRNQEATAETIINGWLHTGDLAQIDADGFVTITGRKKEMIVNSGGENIAPSRVEAEFIAEPEIAQIMVYGDSQPHLVALIVPSVEVREETKAAQRQNISKAVRRANSRLSGFERVRRFHILNDEFTIENNMLTPTLKVRRHIVSKIYKSTLDKLYGSGKK